MFPWTETTDIVLGFTGTKRGQTVEQQATVQRLLRVALAAAKLSQRRVWVLHGDCVGADAQTHTMAKALGCLVGLFPPTNPRYRAFCEGADYVHEPLEYLERDRIIGQQCLGLIGTPKETMEQIRSGTWYTIRYTSKLRHPTELRFKRVNVVQPDGTVKIRQKP